MIKDFKFKINVSVDYYTEKYEAVDCLTSTGAKRRNKEKMAFREEELTLDEFVNKAISGYAFCNLFQFDINKQYWIKSGQHWTKTYPVYRRGHNNGAMKLSFKSDRFFYGAQVIFVDIDFTRFEEINDYIDCLSFKPTCVYCSYSDDKMKGGITSRRFRMVYVFDKVLTKDEFISVSRKLYDTIVYDTDEKLEDDCGERMSQYMNGVYGNYETYKTYEIYSVDDFMYEDTEVEEEITEEDDEDYRENESFEIDNKIVYDMEHLSVEKFMHYYSQQFIYYYRTQYNEFNFGVYAETDDNYISLYYNRETVMDGNKRRKKLFDRACLRRIMKPEITPEELLFNLYVDRNKFFDNSDGVLTVDCLVSKVKNAFAYSIDELKVKYSYVLSYYKEHKPSFVISDKILRTEKRKYIGKVRKMRTSEKIGDVYDLSLTVEENLSMFQSLGIKVGKTTIYNWLKENKLSSKAHKKEVVYDFSKSIRENAKNLEISYYEARKLSKTQQEEKEVNEPITENNKITFNLYEDDEINYGETECVYKQELSEINFVIPVPLPDGLYDYPDFTGTY